MKINTEIKINIDVVFTWVDGSDEKHQQKMKPFYKGKNNRNNKQFRTRFDQVNEIEFSVKSIIKFAPYIKRIFIVTDDQTPSFLENYNKNRKINHPEIIIVDHTEIFPKDQALLPVFNCRPIETLLYKIPNLSEHFIYFNDDFLLLKKTKISDFFINGNPVLRGKWTLFDENKLIKILHEKILKLQGKPSRIYKYGYKRGQQNAAKIVGFNKKYFRIDHTPAPMRKSTFIKYYKEHIEIQQQNIRHRFRNTEQYVLQSLANHIEINNNTCTLIKKFQLLYIGSYKKPLFWYSLKLKCAITNNDVLFLCLQSLDMCPPKKTNYLLTWLNKHLK